MAELAVAAAVLQVAGAGLKLSWTLYDFGSAVSSVREHTDFIAQNVNLYAGVLKTLGQRLKNGEPVHSTEALGLAWELQDQSEEVFEKIQSLLPKSQKTSPSVSVAQRIAWVFRKSRVKFLVGQLDSLKATVSLLVTITYAGRMIHSYQHNPEARQSLRSEIQMEVMQAKNIMVERQASNVRLHKLQEAAELENKSMPCVDMLKDDQWSEKDESTRTVIKHEQEALAIIDASVASNEEADPRAMILHKSDSWIDVLLDHWTILGDGDTKSHSPYLELGDVALSSSKQHHGSGGSRWEPAELSATPHVHSESASSQSADSERSWHVLMGEMAIELTTKMPQVTAFSTKWVPDHLDRISRLRDDIRKLPYFHTNIGDGATTRRDEDNPAKRFWHVLDGYMHDVRILAWELDGAERRVKDMATLWKTQADWEQAKLTSNYTRIRSEITERLHDSRLIQLCVKFAMGTTRNGDDMKTTHPTTSRPFGATNGNYTDASAGENTGGADTGQVSRDFSSICGEPPRSSRSSRRRKEPSVGNLMIQLTNNGFMVFPTKRRTDLATGHLRSRALPPRPIRPTPAL